MSTCNMAELGRDRRTGGKVKHLVVVLHRQLELAQLVQDVAVKLERSASVPRPCKAGGVNAHGSAHQWPGHRAARPDPAAEA
jgi:hypothetical protein